MRAVARGALRRRTGPASSRPTPNTTRAVGRRAQRRARRSVTMLPARHLADHQRALRAPTSGTRCAASHGRGRRLRRGAGAVQLARRAGGAAPARTGNAARRASLIASNSSRWPAASPTSCAAVPRQHAVDPGRGDARMERRALERRPAALRQHVVALHGERRVVDQHQVGGIAFAQEAAFVHVEQLRRRVRELLHDLCRGRACLRAPVPARRPARTAPAAGRWARRCRAAPFPPACAGRGRWRARR